MYPKSEFSFVRSIVRHDILVGRCSSFIMLYLIK